MSSIRPDAPILPIPEVSIPVSTSLRVPPAAAIAAISTAAGSGIAIEGAEDLSIAAISHFESLLAESERDLRPDYETLPESLRHKIEELVYWHEVETRGKTSITDPQYGEHAVESDIRVLFDIELKGIDQIPELLSLSELLQAPGKDIPAIQTAWNLLSPDIKNKIYYSLYKAHVTRNGKTLCPDQNGEPFGRHYTRKHLRNLLTMQVPKFGTTLWKEAIISTVISTARKANALQYRIPGKDLIVPEVLQQHYNEKPDSKFLDTICFLLSNGWSVGPEYRPETKTLGQDSFSKAVRYAASNGLIETLRFLLSQGRSISQAYLGEAVRFAAEKGHLEVIEFLLSQGRSIPQEILESAMIHAAGGGHLETLRFLFSEERSIIQESVGRQASLKGAVIHAARNGHLEVIEFLLPQIRSNPQENLEWAVRNAAENGHLEVIQFLLSQGRSISQESLGAAVKRAAGNGHLEAIRFLLSQGTSISQEDLGEAVKRAAENGHLEVIQALLSQRRSISQEDLGFAIMFASSNGHLAVIQFLLSQGRSIRQQDLGEAVRYAAEKGHLAVIQFLLSQGRSISQAYLGEAVRYATERNQPAVIQFLLSQGRSIRQQDLGWAVRNAAENRHHQVIRSLLSQGRSIPQENLEELVTYAANHNYPEVIQSLLSDGRTLSRQERDRLIINSAYRGRASILEVLLQQGPIHEHVRDSAITQAGRFLQSPSLQLIGTIQDILRMAPVIPAQPGTLVATIQINIPVGSFATTLDSVNSDPEEHLKTICEGGFPRRVVLSDNPNAVDLGGVTKQFISTLMKALRPKLLLTEAGLPQNERADDSYPRYKTLYMQLGRFYALMDVRNAHRTDKFVAGALLDPSFFTIVKTIATESSLENRRREVAKQVLATNPESIASQLVLGSAITTDALQAYREGIGCNEGEELETAQAEIDSFIEAAQNFYDGATESFQSKIRHSDPTLLARILQGEPASQEALLAAIEKDARLPEERFRWIQEKIQTSDEPWRIRFVKAITGNEVLSPGIRIQIGACWRGPGVFELHTCFNSLDVSTGVVPENLRRSLAEEVLAADPENIGALLVLGREVTPEALQGYRNAKGCAEGQELEAAKKEIDHHQFMAALDAILVGEGYNIA